jgi:MFS family permease
MIGTTISTTLSGRSIAKTGRYKHFPIIGLGVMSVALGLLAAVARQESATATALCLLLFGLGFGLVSQMLVVAVQNSVERTELGIATATTTFFRALGGSVGAAGLGAVFAARADHAGIADAVQTVFLVAAPLAALAAIALLWLPQKELQGR